MPRSPLFLRSLLLILAAAASLALAEDRCTAIAVGPFATTFGGTLNTHADDCYDCDFRILRVPAMDHAPNATRAIPPMKYAYPRYVGSDRGPAFEASALDSSIHSWEPSPIVGTIPQVPHTYAYIDGSYGIANEHGVTLGESTCGGKLIAAPTYDGGRALLEVSELGRIGLERARTAREAIAVMGEIAERYGVFSCSWGPEDFMEAGESYSIADGKEVWLMHISPDDTGSSAVWVAQRIPDDHVTVVTNTFRIRAIPPAEERDPDYWAASSNIETVALRAGLWSGNVEGTGPLDGPLDWKKHYGYTASPFKEPYVSRRTWRVFSLLAPSLNLTGDMTSWELPLSVRPDFPISAATLKAVHRDHFEGTKYDTSRGLAAGPFGNPNRYDAYDATPHARDLRAPLRADEPRAMFNSEMTYLDAAAQGGRSAAAAVRSSGGYTRADLAAAAAAGDVDNVDRSEGEPMSEEDVATGHFERTLSLFRTAYTVISETMPPMAPTKSKTKATGADKNDEKNEKNEKDEKAVNKDYFGVRTWVAPHQPRTSVFVPLYPASPAPVPAPLASGSLFKADPSSLWWAACAVSNYAERAWRYITRDTDAARAALEKVTDAEALAITEAGRAALAVGAKTSEKQAAKASKGAGTSKEDKKAAKAAEKKAKSDARAQEKVAEFEKALKEYTANADARAGVKAVEHVSNAADIARAAAAGAVDEAAAAEKAAIEEAAAEKEAAEKAVPAAVEVDAKGMRVPTRVVDPTVAAQKKPEVTVTAKKVTEEDNEDDEDDGDVIVTWTPPSASNLCPHLVRALTLSIAASAAGGLPVAHATTRALADAHASAAVERAHAGYWALFWRMLTRYHDGYRLDSSSGPEFSATALFYPTWWLKAVRYWRQDSADVAAKAIETDAEHWGGDHCAPPASSSSSASALFGPESASSAKSSGRGSQWGVALLFFLGGCLLFLAGAFAGARWAASNPGHNGSGLASVLTGSGSGSEYAPIAQEEVASYGSR